MRGPASVRTWLWPALLAVAVALAAAVIAVTLITRGTSPAAPAAGDAAAAANPGLDAGTPMSGPAPDFTLTDQFGRHVSLRSFRGRVVILAFIDSECRTICPLTTEEMIRAKRLLGASSNRVQLLGVDANPAATAVSNVRAFSHAHGVLHQWRFLTAPLPQLQRVWKAYHIYVQIRQGEIDHTPGLFMISPAGKLARVYMSQMAYRSIDQQAQVLARDASSLLPGHPQVRSSLSYELVPLVRPTEHVALPRAGGGTVRLGPGSPRLLVFFATWLGETSDLAARLDALGSYQAEAAHGALPDLTAVDEGSVESSPSALPRFLRRLPHPLPYPVAIDRSGRVADGYRVGDQPWYVLTSSSGRILWHHDGWLAPAGLARQVRATLARS